MKSLKPLGIMLVALSIFGCKSTPSAEINISNNLNIDRTGEVVEIDLKDISNLLSSLPPEKIVVKDGNTNQVLLSQLIDLDEDGVFDQLIFQSDFLPLEKKHFHIEGITSETTIPISMIATYARFVPERIDDFAWENDKVAFRTYGPKAQQITESGEAGGTLSSGIDCWLKRVDYPIINKWYKQDLEEGKSYHEDHGEGLDNYHVGASRGTGGIGIWKDSVLFSSKNYLSWKIITNGPIRTTFDLDYGTWDANGISVKETKRISIDLGSNLYKCTLLLANHSELPNVTLGISLHEKAGSVSSNVEKGWFSYLEPLDDSELSTALVVDPKVIIDFIDYRTEKPDLSNLLVVCQPKAMLIYYAGFAWKKSNQFILPEGFNDYLEKFAECIASPLSVEVLDI